MNRIYFDNTATTPIDPDVFEAMKPFFTEKFGNPSSVHSYGRETKLAIETARKTVAKIINAGPSEVFFTSCATESTNTAINASIHDLGCRRIITSPIEHHATLHTVEYLKETGQAKVSYVKMKEKGEIDLEDLKSNLENAEEKCLVTLMHGNNEIGNVTDIDVVAELCGKYGAVFHTDTVQTLGHFPIDVKQTGMDFMVGSAHKFHGPKGVGILYVKHDVKMKMHAYLQGGGQERNMRAGTENIYGIVGLAKALQIAADRMREDEQHIRGVRDYMKKRIEAEIPGIWFNGQLNDHSLYTVLSVAFPYTEKSNMALFNLDIHGICASGGSACNSGAIEGSHVITALPDQRDQTTIRFSFSKYNTTEEVDRVVDVLKKIL